MEYGGTSFFYLCKPNCRGALSFSERCWVDARHHHVVSIRGIFQAPTYVQGYLRRLEDGGGGREVIFLVCYYLYCIFIFLGVRWMCVCLYLCKSFCFFVSRYDTGPGTCSVLCAVSTFVHRVFPSTFYQVRTTLCTPVRICFPFFFCDSAIVR